MKLKTYWMTLAVFPAGCLSLVACWPCFQMKWTHRLTTALFMVDVSALSNMREETGPPMFICHVCTQRCWRLIINQHCKLITHIWFLTCMSIVKLREFSLCILSSSDHPEEEFRELLEGLLSAARVHGVVLTPQEEFHLTVSQTVVLRHHWIQPFTQSLRADLTHCKRLVYLIVVCVHMIMCQFKTHQCWDCCSYTAVEYIGTL